MQLAFGPPGHKGVTHLMAVGDALTTSPADDAMRLAGGVSLAVLALGALTKKPRLVNLGLGGFVVADVVLRGNDRVRIRAAGGVSLAALVLGAFIKEPRLVHMGLGGAAVAGVAYAIRPPGAEAA